VKTFIIAVVCTCWLVLTSCDVSETSLPVVENELPGTYAANFQAGLSETIELRPDKSYTYKFESKDHVISVINGSWNLFDPDSHHPEVILSHFMCPYPLDMGCYSTNARLAKLDTVRHFEGLSVLKRSSGRYMLVRCPNENQFYVRQETSK
jgi:hypothetical protein